MLWGNGDLPEMDKANASPFDTCDTDLSEHLDQLGVPGLAAAIVRDGEIDCISVAGYADIEDEQPVTPETLFLVASVSKTVTTTALMQLYERGEFELDDEINDYLPFDVVIPSAPDTPITFQHLLTHTASLKDNQVAFNAFTEYGEDSDLPLSELVEEYLTPDGEYYNRYQNFLAEPPGKVSHYANIGIVLIGYLVEEISGQSFDEYCRANIFQPLGMDSSAWKLSDVDEANLATPYDTSWFGFNELEQYSQANYPDGMLRTTPTELARFLIAYLEGGRYKSRRILRADTVDEILTPHTNRNGNQGLVWFSRTIDDRFVWGHDGSDDGASAEIWFDPAKDVGVILMANGPWGDEDDLLESLFEETEDY